MLEITFFTNYFFEDSNWYQILCVLNDHLCHPSREHSTDMLDLQRKTAMAEHFQINAQFTIKEVPLEKRMAYVHVHTVS